VIKYLNTIILALCSPALALAQTVERFPKPDFQTEYTRPVHQIPLPRTQFLEYFDLFVLIAALSLASYFALKLRSRTKMFVLMIFSLAYFGFFREGCICPVGSVQNISLALFNSGYAIPLTVIAFFALPLLFTLFFGRTFCAGVCPLGAIQDVVVLKPTNVAGWVDQTLGIFPYIYLGLAVLFASTGAGFVVCQYDPFVGLFRFGATFNMLVLGISMLLLGTVVARPYCRYLCPYGVLLNWMSRLSKWHATISPSECINCRLCEASCPFGSIKMPTEQVSPARRKSVKQLAVLLVMVPLIVVGSGWVVSRLHVPLSGQHHIVSLAAEIQLENSGQRIEQTDETKAFRGSGKPNAELFAEARAIQEKFKFGSWILGMFIGLIFGVKLINLTVFKRQTEYNTDRGTCFSCARCFTYCPVEQVRLGNMDPDEIIKLKASSQNLT
jgi:NosR/NirI family transcriptional regulator, nitrous oxide reductase regulator